MCIYMASQVQFGTSSRPVMSALSVTLVHTNFVPRPSTLPAFDHFQYVKLREMAWGILLCYKWHTCNNIVTPPFNGQPSHVHVSVQSCICTGYKPHRVCSRKRTQARSHDLDALLSSKRENALQ